jgi:putative hemolysin
MIIAGIICCILAAGFFAGMETGLVAANQMKIYSEREKGRFYARCAHFLLHKPDRFLATTLIGTNLVVVSATVLFLTLLQTYSVPTALEFLCVFGLTLVILIFAEIIPKSFFRNHADTITLRCTPLLVFFHFLFLPVSVILNTIIRFVLFLFGKHHHVKKIPRSREDLRLLLKLISREISLPVSDQKLIDDLFNFPDTKAREVMIPFYETPVTAVSTPVAEVIRISARTGARFIPVFSRRSDNIVGYVDIEDFLCETSKDIRHMMREAVFYPETKRIPELLLEMNKKSLDLVFLCDEYGLISGIITVDEIVSDIVGHIPGDNNEIEEEIRSVSQNRFIVLGNTGIDDFTQKTGIDLEQSQNDTSGGFLCEKLGEIPKIGTIYTGKGAVFKVLERDKRQIKKIEIHKIETDE